MTRPSVEVPGTPTHQSANDRITLPPEVLRARLHRWAIGLSIFYVLDIIVMTWALAQGGYGPIGYVTSIFLPAFIPALVIGTVVSIMYLHGFRQRGWTARKAERLFFILLPGSVAAKVILVVGAYLYKSLS